MGTSGVSIGAGEANGQTAGAMSTRALALPIFVALVLFTASACGGPDTRPQPGTEQQPDASDGRLEARPGRGGASCAPGEHTLRLGGGRTALMRVTPGTRNGGKALLVVLHGAGSGGSGGGLYAFRGAWDLPGLVLVAPRSEGPSWSAIRGLPDADAESVDRALRRAFARCRVDRRLIGIGGFSDGATYALRLGLENGDLFGAIVALSPGGLVEDKVRGKPRVFIAHGNRDTVLPREQTSDIAFRELKLTGYRVTYRRFVGGHEARPQISREAVRWFLDGR
jgi:phospholipase/carboxylesterase